MTQISRVVASLKEIIAKWVDPALVTPYYYGNKPKQPCVSFEVAQNNENHVIIRIMVRWDPFGGTTEVCERTHYSIEYIDQSALTNQLLHALTFQSSPYYWDGSHFKKRMEIM